MKPATLEQQIGLLARRWRRYSKRMIKRGRKPGPKDRMKQLKDFAQGGIYAICACYLEDALRDYPSTQR